MISQPTLSPEGVGGHKPGAEEPESVETAKVKPKRKVGVQHSEVSSQDHQGDFRSNY